MSIRWKRPVWIVAVGLTLLGTAPAAQSAGPEPLPAPSKLVTRTYAIADLVIPIEDADAPPKKSALEDRLIHLITRSIAPASWAERGGPATIDYYPLGHSLVVCQTPAVHEQIAELFEQLCQLQDLQVVFEVRGLSLSDACVKALRQATFLPADKAEPVFLNDREAAKLLEVVQADRRSNVLQAPKMRVFNGQRMAFECSDRRCVAGVLPAGVSRVSSPEPETIATGVRMSVRPVVSADHRYVKFNLKADVGPLDVPGAGPQAVPLHAEHSLAMRPGRTVLLSAGRRGRADDCKQGENVFLMVTARTLVQREAEEARTAGPSGKLAELMALYQQACAEGRPEAARNYAARCLEIDPTCFHQRDE